MTRTTRARTKPTDPAWVKPHVALTIAFLAASAAALLPSENHYQELWRTDKYVSSSVLIWGALAVTSFVFGVLAGRGRPDHKGRAHRGSARVRADEFAMSRQGGHIAFWSLVVACSGVLIWMLLGFQRGLSLNDVQASTDGVRGASGRNRDLLRSPIWLSPMLHASVFAAGLSGIVLSQGRRRSRDPLRLRILLGYITLVALATGRSFLASERLALLEVLVPFFMAIALSDLWSSDWYRLSRRRRMSIRYLPALFAIVVVSIFAVFELSRSWTYYSSESEQSYAEFIEDRIVGYYATAMNNSALLERDATPILPTARTEEWLAIGLLNDLPQFFRSQANAELPSYLDILADEANPEFNNPGGFYTPFHDFGVVGGVAFWVALGLAAGRVFRRARNMDLVGLLLYSQVLLALSEVPRILLFGEGRWLFPATYTIILGATQGTRLRQRGTDDPTPDTHGESNDGPATPFHPAQNPSPVDA